MLSAILDRAESYRRVPGQPAYEGDIGVRNGKIVAVGEVPGGATTTIDARYRVVSPGFLLNHSRYAILGIVILAAIITPTPDVFNLMLFAVPMCLLFFLGIFASYLLVLKREKRKFP